MTACQLEKNFKNPQQFIPERWLKDHSEKELNVNPYLVLPFGHGMRSCIARRFAEQNMLIALLRVSRFSSEFTRISNFFSGNSKLQGRMARKNAAGDRDDSHQQAQQ